MSPRNNCISWNVLHAQVEQSGDVSVSANKVGYLALWRNKRARQIFNQVALVVVVALLIWYLFNNAVQNLQSLGIPFGMEFLSETASYDINQTLIHYTSQSTHGRAALVGVLNTVVLAVLGVALATAIGLFVGIWRLSRNFLLRKVSQVYVEGMRNVPLLIHILFWQAIFFTLPVIREAPEVLPGLVLSNRGLLMPQPIFRAEFVWVLLSLVAAVAVCWVWVKRAARIQTVTGRQLPIFLPVLGILAVGIAVPTLILYAVTGNAAIALDVPTLGRFNYSGGMTVRTEFLAMLVALSLYTGSFIAEIVRSGILAVDRGQTEASRSLGVSPSLTMRLVVLPQALRVIIPPLTNQYLNLTKNSSLAITIGYADITATLGGITLNQTGRALECIGLLLMFYLSLSLLTSVLMGWFNRKTAIVTR